MDNKNTLAFVEENKVKKISEIFEVSGLKTSKRVLEEGQKLYNENLVEKSKVDGQTAYVKIDFYSQNYKKILSLSRNPSLIDRIPTKSNPNIRGQIVTLTVPKMSFKIKKIYIDDIDSFKNVRKIELGTNEVLEESQIKKGLQTILNENGKFNDWGGETSDLTTQVIMGGKKYVAAFALKGRGTGGILTPKKMGKNGDQIQRLFGSPADVFIIQYHQQIADSVVSQMETYATVTSIHKLKKIFYGIIDGKDTMRLVSAYAKEFKS
jgi:hypothetical protein